MAEVAGVGSYYNLDAFKRRDGMAAAAAGIAEEIAGVDLLCDREMTPDERALVSALKPFATEVVESI